MKYLLLFFFAVVPLFSQQQKLSFPLDHPLTFDRKKPFSELKTVTSVPETLHVAAIMVEFQPDSIETTTGNGLFDTSHTTEKILDPPPHNKTYFEDHLQFAQNYFRKVSNGKLFLDYTLFDSVIRLSRPMRKYSPSKTSVNFYELDTLIAEAWHRADSLFTFSFDSTKNWVFVIFHAGVGRDIDLASAYGYDPRPHDIPSLYKSFSGLQKNYGNTFRGFPVEDSSFFIANSIILPETESRDLPSSFGGDVFVQFGINGMLCANIASHLGLPDLFNTSNGRSGIGRFGLMDGEGIFAWNGFLPPEPSAWEKYFLGWVEPTTLQSSRNTFPLPAVSLDTLNDTILRVPISAKEYFLVENRIRDARNDSTIVWMRYNGNIIRKAFWRDERYFSSSNQDSLYGTILDVDEFDFSLPGGFDEDDIWHNGGILVWHIDENVIEEKYATNEVNANPKRRGVELEQANGAQDIGEVLNTVFGPIIGSGSAFDFWFKDNPLRERKDFEDEFTPTSYPNSKSNYGANSHISFSNFSPRDSVMTFDVQIGDEEVQPLAGFPKYVGEQFGKNSVRVADIDNDGENEIVVLTNGRISPMTFDNSKIYSWNFDGSEVFSTGFTNGLFSFLNTSSLLSPTISNLNSNNNYILSIDRSIFGNRLYVFFNQENLNGFADTLFTKRFAKKIVASPVVSDSVIAIPAEKGYVYFLRFDGSLIDSMQLLTDSTDEIVSISNFNATNGFLITSQKGILLKIFASPTFGIAGVDPYGGTNLGANISNSSIIGNISTNDDRIVTVSSDGEVFSLTSFFLNTSGFPKQTYDSIYTSPILADLNNDGQRDIIVLSGTKFFAFNASGSLLDYFPVQTTSTTRFLAQPLAADVDGNGSMDIVAVSQEGLVFAYDNRGKLLNGFPLLSGKNNGATPAISLYADTIALVVASDDGNVYAWKTGTVNPTTWKSEWTQYQHDAQGSGLIDSPLSGQPISNSFFPKERAYNYPNPVYGNDPLYGNNTIIRYYLKDDATVKIRIFDLAGDMLKEMNGTGNGGFDNEVKWDVSEIQSGVYFAHIEAKGAKATAETIIKIAVVK